MSPVSETPADRSGQTMQKNPETLVLLEHAAHQSVRADSVGKKIEQKIQAWVSLERKTQHLPPMSTPALAPSLRAVHSAELVGWLVGRDAHV